MVSDDEIKRLVERRVRHVSLHYKRCSNGTLKKILVGFEKFGIFAEQCGHNYLEVGDRIKITQGRNGGEFEGQIVTSNGEAIVIITDDKRLILFTDDIVRIELISIAADELQKFHDSLEDISVKERDDAEKVYKS